MLLANCQKASGNFALAALSCAPHTVTPTGHKVLYAFGNKRYRNTAQGFFGTFGAIWRLLRGGCGRAKVLYRSRNRSGLP